MSTTLTITSTKQGVSYDEATAVAAFSTLENFARLAGSLLRRMLPTTAGLVGRQAHAARA